MINMGDDSHISDVLPLVHGGTHLFHGKVHHFGRKLLKVVEVVVTSWITIKKEVAGLLFLVDERLSCCYASCRLCVCLNSFSCRERKRCKAGVSVCFDRASVVTVCSTSYNDEKKRNCQVSPLHT